MSLARAVSWLRSRLEATIAGDQATPGESATPPPALLALSQRLGLSAFEQKILLLCAAPELAPELAGLYAQAQGQAACQYPTYALALSLFEDATWDALSPEGPLRYWRLIEIDGAANRPLTTRPLQADERIVHALKGLNQLDHRLCPFLLPMPPAEEGMALSPSQQEQVDEALSCLERAASARRWPVLQLVGPDPISRISWISVRLGIV